jgi:hypothetical protein
MPILVRLVLLVSLTAGASAQALASVAPLDAPAPAAAADGDASVLPGLIIEFDQVEIDAAGRVRDDTLPGARPRRPMSAAVRQRVDALRVNRDAIGARSAAGAAFSPMAPLPGDDNAPPRLDSGAADPDRLHTIIAPPHSR